MQIIRSRGRAAIAAALLLTGSVWAGYAVFGTSRASETTLDAYIAADFTLVAPKIAGLVDKVLVEDNQPVKAGQALATIDDRDLRAALAGADADVEAARAEVGNLDAEIAQQPSLIAQAAATVRANAATTTFARANAARYRNLSNDGAGTIQEQQQSVAQLSQNLAIGQRDIAALDTARGQLPILKAARAKAVATLRRAEALREQARLNLSYTVIRAPIAGVVGRRSIRPGAYVNVGSVLLAIVPTSRAYVVANFQESQIGRMRLRQPATITVDSFPGLQLRGHVESLAPATDVSFSPLQPDNATGNFTKIVQRIPVKIVIEPKQQGADLLRVGMSVTPVIDVSAPGGTRVGAARRSK